MHLISTNIIRNTLYRTGFCFHQKFGLNYRLYIDVGLMLDVWIKMNLHVRHRFDFTSSFEILVKDSRNFCKFTFDKIYPDPRFSEEIWRIWDLRSETWDLGFETWAVRLESWDLRLGIWDLRLRTWNLRLDIRDPRSEAWDLRAGTWDLRVWDLRSESLILEIWESETWGLKLEI